MPNQHDDFSEQMFEKMDIPPQQTLKRSTLRKFDRFARIYKSGIHGAFTCSSKSTYSFRDEIDVLSEEDTDQCEEDDEFFNICDEHGGEADSIADEPFCDEEDSIICD